MFQHLLLSATLILNWNEDGMIYRKKAGYKEAVAKNKDNNAIQVNKMVAPSLLNPYIRGLRVAFELLFCFLDIGYALYLVTISTFNCKKRGILQMINEM